MMQTAQEYILDRIEINPESECWEWQKAILANGYGIGWFWSKHWKAHRLSYTAFVEIIPEGLVICHKCDNKVCVNPDHLFTGTQLDNVLDREKKGRGAKGEDNGNSILNEPDVLEIKQRLANGEKGISIAKDFNVQPAAISKIKCGRSWKSTGG